MFHKKSNRLRSPGLDGAHECCYTNFILKKERLKVFFMKKINKIETSTYKYKGIYIDIVKDYVEKSYDVWLYTKTAGIKKHVFGAMMSNVSEEQMLFNASVSQEEIDDYKYEYNL